jgi:hypothetical protein
MIYSGSERPSWYQANSLSFDCIVRDPVLPFNRCSGDC